uniref:HAT C-terminal dimerisation domain-containing protein n=1 Tax=Amphimedon queenslandica TaxID=400682 RepID=A0A1X7T7Q7_AMPQE
MNMGEQVSQFLVRPNIAQIENDIMGLLHHVQLFYIEAAKQIKIWFPIEDLILKSLIVLNPSAINSNSSQEVISLAHSFPNIINDTELHNEWREIQFLDPNDLPLCSAMTTIDVDSFWGKCKMTKTSAEEHRFLTVSKLMTSLLSLPHSNADVERIFSQVVLMKTKPWNCLNPARWMPL